MSPARLALPWYVHPAEAPQDWAWLAGRHRDVSFVVANVHNGPGTDSDEYYPEALARLRHMRVLGYVPVHYGRRPVQDVVKDIAAWQQFYQVDGILLDEIPASEDSLARCVQYASAARNAGITYLAANPGTFPTSAHLDLFDVTAVFEGTAESYKHFRHPGWSRDVSPSRLWHLVYACGPDQIAAVQASAVRRGAAHVFATDRSLPNPWLGPPASVSARLRSGPPLIP
ncbi:spherulation-specific family 4 protein [Arthrobacter sp. zg-Y769]|uniref:spherulation-specific family 4 protein n=1 Tax=Arthrobacter sp. zg-Y769 TaxID=2894191 RepID=UPI001E4D816A|nr:spherulation-specific family 4 protein [Arthrobacter sp. zg-Y769]MCC9206224.1 spherulation-specific family 4 protein [Arthrobacter sp. zg-Y769]